MDLSRIKNDIPKEVYEWGENCAHKYGNSFVAVLSYRYGEIVERTFALRRYTKKGVLITEVRRRATGDNSPMITKNLLYGSYCGYVPVYENKDRYSRSGGWSYKVFDKEEFDVWEPASLPLRFYTIYLNKDILTQINEFKYCGYSHGDIIEYLNKYRKDHSLEFFGKLDLPISPLLISRAKKDKQFRRFLFDNAPEVRTFPISATIYAYKHKISITNAQLALEAMRAAFHKIPALKGQNLDFDRIIDYCKANKIDFRTYNDYLVAVIELGLDLNDTKNIYPRDFSAMHDLRISEHESQKAKLDREKRKELYESFAKAGANAVSFEYSDNNYTMIAPRDISDLAKEGKILGHCVGKMGYDKKMADGEVVIMFLRQAADLAKPFVTIEYDLKKRKLLQAHGKSNSKPPDEALAFINKWCEFMQNLQKKAKKFVYSANCFYTSKVV